MLQSRSDGIRIARHVTDLTPRPGCPISRASLAREVGLAADFGWHSASAACPERSRTGCHNDLFPEPALAVEAPAPQGLPKIARQFTGGYKTRDREPRAVGTPERSGRARLQRLRKNPIRSRFERARLPVAPQKPNKINSGFSRRINYSTREGLFPQPLQPCRQGR